MTSFLLEVNQFTSPLLPTEIWSIIEMGSALFVFYMSLWLRVHVESFKSSSDVSGWIGTKLGQIGLYIQTIISMVVFVDGWQAFSEVGYDSNYISHTVLILAMVATALIKYNVFNTRGKIYD